MSADDQQFWDLVCIALVFAAPQLLPPRLSLPDRRTMDADPVVCRLMYMYMYVMYGCMYVDSHVM